MRRVAVAAVAASAFVFGASGVAYAVNADQSIAVSVKSNKAGTKKKPKSVGLLNVTIKTTPKDPAPAFATKQAVVFFDKNLVFNAAKFPSCTLAQAQAQSGGTGSACTKAKVGTGSAKAIAGGSVPVNDISVTLFNGPKGKSLWLHIRESQFNVNSIMTGKLAKASGKFGKKLVVTIPENLQQTAGLWITLTEFVTNVSKTYKKTPYIGLAGCAGGKLNFAADFTFAPENDVLHADAPPVACKK